VTAHSDQGDAQQSAMPVRTSYTVSRRPHGAARAADTARTPQLPLTLPLRRRLMPVDWRERQTSQAALGNPKFRMCGLVCSRSAIIRVARNLSRAPTASLRDRAELDS
jgi:hypothetical protein